MREKGSAENVSAHFVSLEYSAFAVDGKTHLGMLIHKPLMLA